MQDRIAAISHQLQRQWAVLRPAIGRHRHLFLMAGGAGMLLVMVAGLLLPRTYGAEATLRLLRAERCPLPVQPPDQLAAEMVSWQAIDRVLHDPQIGVSRRDGFDANPWHSRITSFTRPAGHDDEAQLVMVRYAGPERHLAPSVVNQLVAGAIQQAYEGYQHQIIAARTAAEHDVLRLRAEVDRLSADRLEIQENHLALLPDSPFNPTVQLRSARAEYDDLSKRMAAMELTRDQLQSRGADKPSVILRQSTGPNPELSRLQLGRQRAAEQLAQLTAAAEQGIGPSSQPAGPGQPSPLAVEVEALRRRIAALDRQLEQTPAEAAITNHYERNPVHVAAERQLEQTLAQLATMRKQAQALRSQIARLSRESETFERQKTGYDRLVSDTLSAERDLAAAERRLRSLDEAMFAGSTPGGWIWKFTGPAPAEARIIAPTWLGVMTWALIVGLGFGVAAVCIVDRREQTLATPDEVAAATKLLVLASIPELMADRSMKLRWWFGSRTQNDGNDTEKQSDTDQRRRAA